jgi:sialic acid synthase SpsE
LYPYLQFGYADHTAWNEDNNELITLLIASNGMHFIEKHVTNVYGTERCDYSAAISITMLNNLYKKLDLINALSSSGSLLLNDGEREYSKYGPMKMAAVLKMDKNNGDFIKKGDFDFIRCYQESDISQIDIIHIIKKPLKISIQKGTTLCKEMFRLS